MKSDIILAIETSGKICSVALMKNDIIHSEYSIYEGNKHDKFAAEFCRRILNDNELAVNDLSAIAVSIGPGSFTGLRIGTAIAKGLTIDNNPKLIAVPTLSALALNTSEQLHNISDDYNILSIIHSHANMFYYQEFSASSEQLSDIIFTNYEEIAEKYSEKQVIITSNQKVDINFGIVISQFTQIRASIIAKYASRLCKDNVFADSESLIPLYIQEFIPKSTIKI